LESNSHISNPPSYHQIKLTTYLIPHLTKIVKKIQEVGGV
jgi:hypothetical protein